MVRGSKAKYTDKQKRQAEHIEEGYEHRGVSKKAALVAATPKIINRCAKADPAPARASACSADGNVNELENRK